MRILDPYFEAKTLLIELGSRSGLAFTIDCQTGVEVLMRAIDLGAGGATSLGSHYGEDG